MQHERIKHVHFFKSVKTINNGISQKTKAEIYLEEEIVAAPRHSILNC
jgi:hypothetical protein